MTNVTSNAASLHRTEHASFGPHPLDMEVTEEYLSQRFMRPIKYRQKLVYEFTDDPGLMHQYFLLREEMFVTVWGLKNFSGGKDEFDDTSDTLLVRQGRQCIAGVRLTMSTPEHRQRLPLENDDLQLGKLFPELHLQDRGYGETSRLAILPEFRAGMVFPEGARQVIRRAVANDVELIFSISPLPLARSYRQQYQMFGAKVDIRTDIQIPDREEYEGIRMVMSVMDLSHFVRARQQNEAREAALAD